MALRRVGGWWTAGFGLWTATAQGQTGGDPAQPHRVQAAAVLSSTAAMAVADGALWQAVHGAWVRVAMGGAVPRDVTVGRGMLWVLAEGTGAQAGHALVLRAGTGGDLALAGTVSLPPGYGVRVLAVARDQDWVIAGGGPLLRFRNGVSTVVEIPGAPMVAARWMPDEVLSLRHADGVLGTWRWGEARAIGRPGTVALVAGMHATVVLRGDGALENGPPWAPSPPGARPWLPASGIAPWDAVVLRDGRVVEVTADGHGAMYADGGWQTLEPAPGTPLTLQAAEGGAWLVLADGRACELVGRTWTVRVGALGGGATPGR